MRNLDRLDVFSDYSVAGFNGFPECEAHVLTGRFKIEKKSFWPDLDEKQSETLWLQRFLFIVKPWLHQVVKE